MGLRDQLGDAGGKLLARLQALKAGAGASLKARIGRDGSQKQQRVHLLARLPTRLYADGAAARGVAAEGLYGLAKVTVHEAELNPLPPGGSEASSSGSGTTSARTKYYAVVSLGRQTFASKRVRRDGREGASEAQAAGAEGSLRLRWNASANVVLRRSGASVAQVAIYKGGRVRGAMGDTLQCWCKIDLASYFTDTAAADPATAAAATAGSHARSSSGGAALSAPLPAITEDEAAGLGAMEPPAPKLLTTSVSSSSLFNNSSAAPPFTDSDSDSMAGSEAGEEEGGDNQQGPAADAAAGPASSSGNGQHALPEQQAGPMLMPGLQPSASSVSTSGGSGGEVIQDCWLPLVDPGDPSIVRGRVHVSVKAASPAGLEQQLWRRLLALADINGDGTLSAEEFEGLLAAMGTALSLDEVQMLFRHADSNGDGMVDAEELASVLTHCHEEGDFSRLMRRCPVDGAELLPNDDIANIIYVSLCLDEGGGESLRGGYTTPEQVSRSWLIRMTEWATQPLVGDPKALWRGNKYEAGGLRRGAAAAHILVFDRSSKRVVEEAVSPTLTLAMRALYQSPAGRLLLREGALKQLKRMSERYGAYADSPESAQDIPKFLAAFKGQVDMQEALDPRISSYKTFNQFFYRKLKPEARPVADAGDPGVVVSAADCRLTVFNSVSDATRCWIKGRQFSLAGLLADSSEGAGGCAAQFEGGSMAIFRLAPQDYHRFHLPVGGRVESIQDVPGELLTVNPIAVNSPFANVFTRNRRSVMLLRCPGYGAVAFVAVGATVVGSIRWTLEVGQEAPKGADAGYFAFGGSTLVALFQEGAVCWDADLLEHSLDALEVRVLCGERLGVQQNANCNTQT